MMTRNDSYTWGVLYSCHCTFTCPASCNPGLISWSLIICYGGIYEKFHLRFHGKHFTDNTKVLRNRSILNMSMTFICKRKETLFSLVWRRKPEPWRRQISYEKLVKSFQRWSKVAWNVVSFSPIKNIQVQVNKCLGMLSKIQGVIRLESIFWKQIVCGFHKITLLWLHTWGIRL